MRQYFPKSQSLENISQAQINIAVEQLNNRPTLEKISDIKHLKKYFIHILTKNLNLALEG